MSATRRGLIIFGILVVVTAIFCVWLPFFGLPRAGFGVALPWITLPADVLKGNVLPAFLGYDFVNSMVAMLVVDLILVLIGLAVRRAVMGQSPANFVPRGIVNVIEFMVEFWYNQARNVLGDFTPRVLPLALTVFMFVLIGNWVNLIPGVETVGILSCAEPGVIGYPIKGNGPFLEVNGGSLKDRAGHTASEVDTRACEEAHPQYIPPLTIAKCERRDYNPTLTEEECTHLLALARGEKPSGEPAPAGATPPATQQGSLAPGDKLIGYQPGNTTGTANAQQAQGRPDLINVIPFYRQLATDLNVTLAMAIIVFIAVQIWGIQALGGPYFFKFINAPALGNMAKKPMGVMDFIVGLVDIISELSRLISLSFRLLGNIFAGAILLAVMSFMVAAVLPIVFNGLELFVGAIQAYVFAILTVMYASQAVTAHHGEEEHDEPHVVHEAHGEAKPVEQVVDVP